MACVTYEAVIDGSPSSISSNNIVIIYNKIQALITEQN